MSRTRRRCPSKTRKATVWASTQGPVLGKGAVAQALAAQENVRVIADYVGGGFGGKTAARQAWSGASGQITGKPVQVVWDRAGGILISTLLGRRRWWKIRADLTAAGKIAFWD